MTTGLHAAKTLISHLFHDYVEAFMQRRALSISCHLSHEWRPAYVQQGQLSQLVDELHPCPSCNDDDDYTSISCASCISVKYKVSAS